jgi:hypothetical protein
MRNPLPVLPFSFSLSLLTLGAALAQSETPASKPGQPPGRPTSDAIRWVAPVHDVTADGAIHTAGASYVAHFDAAGATFVPFLGETAERAWPVTFRLAAAQVGDRPLPVTAAMPRRDADLVAFDRGGAIEQYLTALDGFEQRFVFATLPARGELRLRIGTTSDLEPSLTDGVHFTGPLGGVRYGHAIAIDGNGRRVAMTTTLVENGLELTVPAEFVANATMPLVVDPLVGTLSTMVNTTIPTRNVDAAWDTATNSWVVAFERTLTATDSNVFVMRVAAYGSGQGPLGTIDSSSTSWRRPRIANLASSDKFLVVAECDDAASAPWIGGRTVTNVSGNWVISAPLTIAKSGQNGAPIGEYTAPDVGGDGAATGNGQWVVVYEYGTAPDRDVHLREVAYDGSVTGVPTLVATTNFDERGPRISKSNGQGNVATQRWAIAYERRTTTSGNDVAKLWGSLVNRDGSLRSLLGQTTWVLSDNSVTGRGGWAASSPTDDLGGSRTLMVVESRPTAANGLDLFVIPFSDLGLGGVPVNLTALEPYGATWIAKPQRAPAVDSDGTRFAIGYVHDHSATDSDIYATTVAVLGNGNLDVHDHDSVTTSSNDEDEVAIASRRSGGGVAGSYGVVVRRVEGTDQKLLTAIYDGLAAGGVVMRGSGCGGLGLETTGTAGLATPLTFSRSGEQGFGGFLAGAAASISLAPACFCTVGTTMDVVVAGDEWTFPIPNNLAVLGVTFSVQAFDLVPVGPCFGQIRASQTADVTVR